MPLGLDVELPTTFGWVKVRELQVGIELFDELGYPVRVVDVSPAYETDGVRLAVGFGKTKKPEPDGELLCGEGQRLLTARHRRLEMWHTTRKLGAEMPRDWVDWVPADGGGWRGPALGKKFAEEVLVEEITPRYSVKHGADDIRWYLDHAIPCTFSLQLQGSRAELDAWVAGVCINYYDQSSKTLKIRAQDLEFYRSRFAAAGYQLESPVMRGNTPYKHLRVGVDDRLEGALGKYLSGSLLPRWVFRAPEVDRMAFLAGLMDQWNFRDFHNNQRMGAWFYTTNDVLGRQVTDLVRTLGYPATLLSRKQKVHYGTKHSGFYVLWQPTALPFTKPELLLRYSHMTKRTGMQVQRFLWKIYEAEKIERILVRDVVVEGRMYAAGRLLLPVRGDDRG